MMSDSNGPKSPKLDILVPDRGHQDRVMTEEEKLDASLEDSMDASDPSEIVQRHRTRDDA